MALIQARRRAISVIFRVLLISISVNSIPPTPENKKAACSSGKPYIKGNYVLRFVLNRDALLLRITNQIIHVL